MDKLWFYSWESIIRTICLTSFGYISMILLLRLSGKRTLSKLNAFDFIVTVALGSCLASVALNKSITLADGFTAFALFIGLQFLLTWLSVRVKAFKGIITSSPSLIFYKGDFLRQEMKKERITEEEIYNAARQKGISSLDEVDMIVLETTGEISIIQKIKTPKKSTLEYVKIEGGQNLL